MSGALTAIKVVGVFLLLAATLLAPRTLCAQAADLPSAAPPVGAGTSDQRGRALLDEMVAALGGPHWLNRTSMETEGHGSAFFHGEPNPYIIEYKETERLAASGQPWATRVGFLTPRGMILPRGCRMSTCSRS